MKNVNTCFEIFMKRVHIFIIKVRLILIQILLLKVAFGLQDHFREGFYEIFIQILYFSI